jgi:hypothetical protein
MQMHLIKHPDYLHIAPSTEGVAEDRSSIISPSTSSAVCENSESCVVRGACTAISVWPGASVGKPASHLEP